MEDHQKPRDAISAHLSAIAETGTRRTEPAFGKSLANTHRDFRHLVGCAATRCKKLATTALAVACRDQSNLSVRIGHDLTLSSIHVLFLSCYSVDELPGEGRSIYRENGGSDLIRALCNANLVWQVDGWPIYELID